MKNNLLLIWIAIALLTSCKGGDCIDYINVAPRYSEYFQVSGQLLYSCNNLVPVPNTSLLIGNTILYTDADGKFSQLVNTNIEGPNNNLYILSGDGSYTQNMIIQGLSPISIKLGKVYAIKPNQIPVIVSYDLSNINLNKFQPIKIEYSRYSLAPDKMGTTPFEFLKPDTVLFKVWPSTGLVLDSVDKDNFGVSYYMGKAGRFKTFKVTSFCDTARVTIRF